MGDFQGPARRGRLQPRLPLEGEPATRRDEDVSGSLRWQRRRVDWEGPLQDATLLQRGLPRGGETRFPEFPEAVQTGVARSCQVVWPNNLQAYGGSGVAADSSALRAYFLAAANVWEPGQAAERLAWARTAMLADAVSGYLLQCNASTPATAESRRDRLISKLENVEDATTTEAEKVFLRALREPIDLPSSCDDDASSHGLREAWGQWLRSWTHDAASVGGNTALLLVRAMECCSGRYISLSTNRNVNHLDDYSQLQQLTHSICCKLTSRLLAAQNGEGNKEAVDSSSAEPVEQEMQELVQCVLQNCSSIDRATGLAFLHVAKSYYYVSHCSPETIYTHISKVIFEDVV